MSHGIDLLSGFIIHINYHRKFFRCLIIICSIAFKLSFIVILRDGNTSLLLFITIQHFTKSSFISSCLWCRQVNLTSNDSKGWARWKRKPLEKTIMDSYLFIQYWTALKAVRGSGICSLSQKCGGVLRSSEKSRTVLVYLTYSLFCEFMSPSFGQTKAQVGRKALED